jgi:hypothetical protein
MKSIQIFTIVLAIALTTLTASAQNPAQSPDRGFWVIITNAANPYFATVKFYDLENHPIYEEQLSGVRLDVNKRKTRKRLNQSLQSALLSWETNKHLLKDKGFVAAQFRVPAVTASARW